VDTDSVVPEPRQVVPLYKKTWHTYAGSLLLGIICLAGIGAYYYFTHKAYTQEQALALIRKNILPSIVRIDCSSKDGGPITRIGSGLYYLSNGTPMVATNAHVILGDDGQYHGCNVYFPRPSDGTFYDSSYIAGTPALYHETEAYMGGEKIDGLDFAQLPLTAANNDAQGVPYPFPPIQHDASAEIAKLCRPKAKNIHIGETLYLLGYPGTGGDSLTLTQGVVSGFNGDFNQWIKVSANTAFGNSGGLAIGATDLCEYGIPAQVTLGQGANLGIVLGSAFITSFLENLTGGYTYSLPATTTEAGAYLSEAASFPDFSMHYPAEWTLSTTSPEDTGTWSTVFAAPNESALDDFNETTTVYVSPHSSEKDFSSTIALIKRAVASVDPEATGRYVTLADHVQSYQILFFDSTQQRYTVPVLQYVILFLRNGTVYEIDSAAEQLPTMKQYVLMFAGMGDSIRFK